MKQGDDLKYPKIIAVDFDGCLATNNWPDIGEPIPETIEALKREREAGAKIILWTCRRDEQLTAAVEWCARQGIKLDAVNANLPSIIEAFGGDTVKVFANEYWDDRARLMPTDANTMGANLIDAKSARDAISSLAYKNCDNPVFGDRQWTDGYNEGVKDALVRLNRLQNNAQTETERSGILRLAITTYGEFAQRDMMIEEMSKLTKAICKLRRGGTAADVLEEMADVQIMLDQMRIMFGDTTEIEAAKVARLAERLKAAEDTRHCFYCEHLILDGMASWCEIRRKAGEVCEEFEFNEERRG